jgi:hypothetical protein
VRKALVSPLKRATTAPIEVPATAREFAILERLRRRGWSLEALLRAALRRKA